MASDFRKYGCALYLFAMLLAVVPVQSFTHVGVVSLQGRPPSLRSEAKPMITMQSEGGLKHKAIMLKAAIAIFGAAWMPKPGMAAPPPMQNVYPASYYMEKAVHEEEEYEMHPIAKFVTDKRFLTTVGVGVVAGGVVVGGRKWQKKNMEDYRKKLASFSDINLDTSILDEARINRPGAKTVNFTYAPKFGSYRAPPEKLNKGVKDKYVWKKEPKKADEQELDSKLRVSIFDKLDSNPSTPAPKASAAASIGVAPVEVEVVGAEEGPKTTEEKAMADALGDFNYEELMNQAMMDPQAMDPSVMAAALPALQAQMAEVLKDGFNPEDVEEVRASFREMGIDLEELFSSIDDLEKAGLASDTLGKEGVEFFRMLRKIMLK